MEEGDLTYRIIGCAMAVNTELGPGLREKPYENSLAIELEHCIGFLQQPRFPIFYKDRPVGGCQPDLLVEDEVVVDCKAVNSIGAAEIGQMLNYLRIVKKSVGLILNFSGPKLDFKRVVL